MSKRALITGGSRGIGSEMVRLFSEGGYEVAFTYLSAKDRAERLSSEYGARAYCVNFACLEQVVTFASKLREDFGDVDVLINNAGISHYGLFQDISIDDFRKVFSINFESMVFLTRELVPSMIQKMNGCIINISSVWGQTGASCEVLYSASKAAVIGFTKALAKELAPSGVRVNCIAPGVVDTDMMKTFSEKEKCSITEGIPLGRFSSPAEVAKISLDLAESDCLSLTGQVIGVNGGMYC